MRSPAVLPALRVAGLCSFAALLSGACGHDIAGGLGPEAIEGAYLAARRAPVGPGAPGTAAPEALASAGRPLEATPPSAPLNVTWQIDLPPDYRLFWLSTTVGDQRLPLRRPPSPVAHDLRVEVQAMRFAGGRPGPLLRLERTLALPPAAAGSVTLQLAEGGDAGAASTAPLALHARVDPAPAPRPPSPASRPPARPSAPPRLERARLVVLPPLRVPGELGRGARPFGDGPPPALRRCLDRSGGLESLRFLDPVHPRLAGSLADLYRDARHEPYRVNDLAVPSCEVVRPQ